MNYSEHIYMSEHTSKLVFTFFPIPSVFFHPESLCKIEQGNHYKREKTAWNFLFQMSWYAFIRKKKPEKRIEKKHKEQLENKGRSV